MNKCDHSNLFTEKFNLEESYKMSVEEIRKKWPRIKCPECNAICYQSMEHYYSGDW